MPWAEAKAANLSHCRAWNRLCHPLGFGFVKEAVARGRHLRRRHQLRPGMSGLFHQVEQPADIPVLVEQCRFELDTRRSEGFVGHFGSLRSRKL